MDPQVQAQLAVLIQKDMELLRARAGDDGVLAYGRKPVPREVPNGRFLQNTLRDLGSGGSIREMLRLQIGLLANRLASHQLCKTSSLISTACSKQAGRGGHSVGQQRASAGPTAPPTYVCS